MDFRIQPLDDAQVREVSDLVKENLRRFEQYGFYKSEIDNLLDYYSEQNISLNNKKPNQFYVVIKDDEVCGIGRVNGKKIESTYIKVGHQRQGLGTALLSFLEVIIRENSHNQVELLSFPEAIGFYEKLRYRQVEEIRDDKGRATRMVKRFGI